MDNVSSSSSSSSPEEDDEFIVNMLFHTIQISESGDVEDEPEGSGNLKS